LSKLAGGGGSATSAEDWRAMGVGGVGSDAVLASGWALPGDEVVVVPSGLEGTVVSVTGPTPGGQGVGGQEGGRDGRRRARPGEGGGVRPPLRQDRRQARVHVGGEDLPPVRAPFQGQAGPDRVLDGTAVEGHGGHG
ncbi:hypothetical protein THAOC_10120, partial [Thalassiosira oceanica]